MQSADLPQPHLTVQTSDAHAFRTTNRLPTAPAAATLSSALPPFQPRLPSFSSLFSDLPAALEGPQYPPGSASGNHVYHNVRQESTAMYLPNIPPQLGHEAVLYRRPPADETVPTTLSSNSLTVPGNDRRSDIHSTENSFASATIPSDQDVSEVVVGVIRLESFRLKVARAVERNVGHASYAVQLQDENGMAQSKSWVISIFATERCLEGPRIYINIYHDLREPHRFRTDPPPQNQWLRRRLCSSRALLQEDAPLSETLENRSNCYRAAVESWQLSPLDKKALQFALDRIGSGEIPTCLVDDTPERPWVCFLQYCRDWEHSGRAAGRRMVRARQWGKKPRGHTCGSLNSSAN